MIRKDFINFINDREYKVGVELGVGHGGFSNLILAGSTLNMLYLIDPWESNYQEYRGGYDTSKERMKKYDKRYQFIQKSSQNAVSDFKDSSIDFIYIDGAHDYENCKNDMKLWWPKLKKGGLFAGHDYPKAPGVKSAVDEFFKEINQEFQITEIEFPDSNEREYGGEEANSNSWFHIKQNPIIFEVITENPIALDSEDHLTPWGTMRDNTGCIEFVTEIEELFHGQKINFLDIGCAGGLLALQFSKNGHNSIGIEGSNYNLLRQDDSDQEKQWKENYEKILFTCDASHMFTITNKLNKLPIQFDLITAWEVFEHIRPERSKIFFQNIVNHLKPNGIYLGTINCNNEPSSGKNLHVNLHFIEDWKKNILPEYFEVFDYPLKTAVRMDGNLIMLKRKQ